MRCAARSEVRRAISTRAGGPRAVGRTCARARGTRGSARARAVRRARRRAPEWANWAAPGEAHWSNAKLQKATLNKNKKIQQPQPNKFQIKTKFISIHDKI